MLLLTDINLLHATSHDFARALNFSIRHSEITKKTLMKQLHVRNKLSFRDIENMYPKDTFTKSNGVVNINFAKEMGIEIQKATGNTKDVSQINMMDFAKEFIKIIENSVKH